LPIEEDIVKYKSKNKEYYIVFFARLVESKGVTESPLIMKYITSLIKDVKLYILENLPIRDMNDMLKF